MGMPSLKSVLAIGAFMVAVSLAAAPAALAAPAGGGPVVVQPAHQVVFKVAVLDQDANRALKAAADGAHQGLADHERRTGEKCGERNLRLAIAHAQHGNYLATAELRATCVRS